MSSSVLAAGPCLIAAACLCFFLSFLYLQAYMDSEIRAIMAQYMPLDNQNEPISRQPILENEA